MEISYLFRREVRIVYFHTILTFFLASRPLRMASFSSGVRLPVIARHNAARISLENSGIIGSLGELTPNIFCPPKMIIILFECKYKTIFPNNHTFIGKTFNNLLI